MALVKKDGAGVVFENGADPTATPFEEGGAATGGESLLEKAKREAAENEAAAAAAAETNESAAPAKTTALAAGGAKGAVATIGKSNPFPAMENVIRCNFNTFKIVKADQGNFVYEDGSVKMGPDLQVEMVSWQWHYMLATGDINNPKSVDFLRFSDDGITATNGDDMNEVLRAAVEAGFTKAKIQKRVRLVANVIDGGLHKACEEKFVQFDLSPNSVNNFQQHQLNVAYRITKGKWPEGVPAGAMKLKAVSKSQNKTSWTEIEFDVIA